MSRLQNGSAGKQMTRTCRVLVNANVALPYMPRKQTERRRQTNCTHLAQYKRDNELKVFRFVHAKYLLNRDVTYGCLAAECRARKRLFGCLTCIYVACRGAHLNDHITDTMHTLFVEIFAFGNVYCATCKDFQYDDDLTSAAFANFFSHAHKRGARVPAFAMDTFLTHFQNREEIKYQRCMRRLTGRNRSEQFNPRPLFNLSDTCFINSVVQVIMRTPLIRDYLLTGRHKCLLPLQDCLLCELISTCREYYCGSKAMHCAKLVWQLWNSLSIFQPCMDVKPRPSKDLQSSKRDPRLQQHDVHEFFLMLLHKLDESLHEQTNDTEKSDHDDDAYSTVVRKLFMGRAQYQYRCHKCNKTSTKQERFFDIQLAITEGTLHDCLQSLLNPEALPDSPCYICESSVRSSTYCLRKMPIVALFVLKRFDNCVRKNQCVVSFPENLNMRKYVERECETGTCQSTCSCDADYQYVLYAVIEHKESKGEACKGHYIAYIRTPSNTWYCCSDTDIRQITLEETLKAQGYLLFYHKKTDYQEYLRKNVADETQLEKEP